MNQSINHGGDCRTAPATPGLLIRQPKVPKLFPQRLLKSQHDQIFSLSVTSVVMKVHLTKEIGNTLE